MNEEIVNKIIDSLCARNGFDNWWFNLDEEIQEEIKQDLINLILQPD